MTGALRTGCPKIGRKGMIKMTEKEQKVNAALWRIGMERGAKAVERYIRQGVDLTDEVKYLSEISKGAYVLTWGKAWDDASDLFPDFEEEIENLFYKVIDKSLPF